MGGEGVELAEALVEGSTLGSESPSAAAAVYNACMSNPDPAVRKVGTQQRLPPVRGVSLRGSIARSCPYSDLFRTLSSTPLRPIG